MFLELSWLGRHPEKSQHTSNVFFLIVLNRDWADSVIGTSRTHGVGNEGLTMRLWMFRGLDGPTAGEASTVSISINTGDWRRDNNPDAVISSELGVPFDRACSERDS